MLVVQNATLFVPFIGRSVNWHRGRGRHPMEYKRLKDQCAAAVRAAGGSHVAPFREPVALQFTPMLGKGVRRWDIANYAITCKMIEDCLVQEHIFPDDTNTYVREWRIRVPVRIGGDSCIAVQITVETDE